MPEPTPRPLNDVMSFDHVVEVHADGTVTDAPSGINEPNVIDDIVLSSEWTLMDGYSGQQSYSGPIMHPSEYIGGGLERDILATPGYYVAVVAHYSTDADGNEYGPEDDDVDGWAVAYQPKPEVAAEGPAEPDDAELFSKVATPGSVRIDVAELASVLAAGKRVYGYNGSEILMVHNAERAASCRFIWTGSNHVPIGRG